MDRDPDRYRLSPDKHRAIYKSRIAPLLFAQAAPVERPTALVLGGQPGAGKSALLAAAHAEFDRRGGLIEIIGDDLRAFHPRYSELQRQDDRTAAFFTDRDSGRWIEMAIADAAGRRCNVAVEGTMRLPDKVAETLTRFRDSGFVTDARALAVNPELSALGILQRFIAQKDSRGYGRMTSMEAHRAALGGMLDTLDRMQDERLADRLTIYRRGGEILHRFDFPVPLPGRAARACDCRARARAPPYG
ncbi:zeta toxin family protein [Novosphingobium panipatense]|uniref:zeta toxin family protein n=1 Tax=Novosphingobium panipatense TaxID=428991 RepID=UPI0036076813